MLYLLTLGDQDNWEKGIEFERFNAITELAERIDGVYQGREDALARDIQAGNILVIRGDILIMSLVSPEPVSDRLRFEEA